MNNIRIAVLLAAFNGSKYISDQVDSIIDQVGVDISLFISVDLSNDKTEEVVDLLSLKYKNITVLEHGKVFGGAAPNFFRLFSDVNFSRFDFVCLADQDDIWKENKLIHAVEIMRKNNIDGFSSNVIAFWEDGRKIVIEKNQPQVDFDYFFEAAGPGCTYVLEINMAKKIQDIINNKKHSMQNIDLHDWFIYMYARNNGYRWFIDKEPLMLYRQHSLNQFGANSGWKAILSRMHKVISGWGFYQSKLMFEIVGDGYYPFPMKNRVDFFKLGLNFRKCRRNYLDKWIFLCACIIYAFFGKKYEK